MSVQPLLRFAPSPTGSLHLGGLRTALFNHLYAKKFGGKWILRVEDTDATRYVPGSVEEIRKSLEWAGLEYDYGPGVGGPHAPYYQSERRDLYRSYAQKLLDSGQAYRCFCTPERLQKTREKLARTGTNATYDKACLQLTVEEVARRVRAGEKSVVRLNDSALPVRPTPPDMVFGSVRDAHASIATDPVLLKSDLFPTYHLAVVVDDHEMGVTHVLRGEEWLPSLPLHLDLYACFGLTPPRFGHLPLLLNPDGTKMSKRKSDVSVTDYVEKGWEPLGVLSWLAMAGRDTTHDHPHAHHTHTRNSPKEQQEFELSSMTDVLTLNDLVAKFDLNSYTNRRTVLDPARLSHLNRHHLFLKSHTPDGLEELSSRAESSIKIAFPNANTSKTNFKTIILALEDRLVNMADLPSLSSFLFRDPDFSTPEAREMHSQLPTENYHEILSESIQALSTIVPSSPWEEDSIRKSLKAIKQKKRAMSILRYALSGKKSGLAVVTMMALLGRDQVLKRLQVALNEGQG